MSFHRGACYVLWSMWVLSAACSSSAAPADAAPDRDASPDREEGGPMPMPEAGTRDASPERDGSSGGTDSCAEGAEPPCFIWGRSLTGPSEEDEIDAVASDAAGNVYVSGKFEQSLTVTATGEQLDSAGAADIMVVKLGPSGDVVWTRHFGGAGEDNIFDAVCDQEGNLIMSGIFAGSVTFGDVALATTGEADTDAVFIKMDPDGNVVWAVPAGSPAPDGGNEVTVSPDGTILVAADSGGDFRAGDIQFELSGRRDSYLLALEPDDGSFRWGRQVLGDGDPRAKCIGVDGLGNVLLGGDFRGTILVRGPNKDVELVSAGRQDAFLSRWTSEGTLEWAKRWGAGGQDLCKGVVGTDDGDAYAVGYFTGTVDFNGTSLTSERERDQYAWRLDPEGETVWLAHVSSATDLRGSEVDLAPDGGLLFTFVVRGPTELGSTDGTARMVDLPPGGGPAWPSLVRYSPTGLNDFVLLPELSDAGGADEISRSGDRVYVDVPIFGGPFEFGDDRFSATGSKDAAITAIQL